MRLQPNKAFTLIEILVVVAIVGLLSAIAVPNFQTAQVRSKVSRAHADMRSLAIAVAAFQADYNRCVPDFLTYYALTGQTIPANDPSVWRQLTTPVPYMTALPFDGFREVDSGGVSGGLPGLNVPYYSYFARGWMDEIHSMSDGSLTRDDFLGDWSITSPGPNRLCNYGEWIFMRDEVRKGSPRQYDPSNGMVSEGDLACWGP